MRKLPLLVGTLGGAMAGYLFSNKKLRDQLANAKDTEAAAKLLGKHLQQDGSKLAKQIREFIESEEVQQNVGKAKQYAKEVVAEGQKQAATKAKKGVKKATTAAKKSAKKAKASAKKTVKSAKKKVKTKTRKLS